MRRAFANLDGLVRLSHTEGVDIRRPLLRVLTDLYVQEKSHTREEEQQYVELTLRLLPAVDAATRAAVARKLAAYPLTPASIIDALTADAPDLAALIASRKSPPAPSAEDFPQELATTSPSSTSRASDIDPLQPAGPVAIDGTSPPRRFGEAFLRADSAERIDMLFRLEDADIVAAADALQWTVRPGTAQRLEEAALAGNRQDFARELQLSLGISNRAAWRIIQDDSGEPVLIAAKALSVPWDVLVRILLFLNPAVGESVERVFALSRLYERLTPPTAAPVVASWREEGAARPEARFQSLHAPDALASTASARENARGAKDSASDHGRRAPGSETRMRGQGTT